MVDVLHRVGEKEKLYKSKILKFIIQLIPIPHIVLYERKKKRLNSYLLNQRVEINIPNDILNLSTRNSSTFIIEDKDGTSLTNNTYPKTVYEKDGVNFTSTLKEKIA